IRVLSRISNRRRNTQKEGMRPFSPLATVSCLALATISAALKEWPPRSPNCNYNGRLVNGTCDCNRMFTGETCDELVSVDLRWQMKIALSSFHT
ncbi:hypothetical protein PENTCL1PPCAC_20743, partial [Pristionchus entomophagus]